MINAYIIQKQIAQSRSGSSYQIYDKDLTTCYSDDLADSSLQSFLNQAQSHLNYGYMGIKPNMPDGITCVLRVKLGTFSVFKAIKKAEGTERTFKIIGDVLYIVF